MQKFRKKPEVIEAMQFTGLNGAEIQAWMGTTIKYTAHQSYLRIYSSQGDLSHEWYCELGDWIAKTHLGLRCYSNDLFKRVYEPTGPTKLDKRATFDKY